MQPPPFFIENPRWNSRDDIPWWTWNVIACGSAMVPGPWNYHQTSHGHIIPTTVMQNFIWTLVPGRMMRRDDGMWIFFLGGFCWEGGIWGGRMYFIRWVFGGVYEIVLEIYAEVNHGVFFLWARRKQHSQILYVWKVAFLVLVFGSGPWLQGCFQWRLFDVSDFQISFCFKKIRWFEVIRS